MGRGELPNLSAGVMRFQEISDFTLKCGKSTGRLSNEGAKEEGGEGLRIWGVILRAISTTSIALLGTWGNSRITQDCQPTSVLGHLSR